jgi:cephalosporin-C deacetylase-like acetyl esterase
MDPRWRDLPHTDTEFVPEHYHDREEWERRREHLRKQILWSAGLGPMPEKTPLNPIISGRITHDDYIMEKVCFESYPGFYVCGNLYRPRNTTPGGHPAVLNPHGHAATGRLHDNEVASYQARCITFARMGCVAFMWDMVDYNDSARQLSGHYEYESYWSIHNEHWKNEKDQRSLWNIGSFGLQLWNSIRALDFLSSLPEVDVDRLACTGESGGGTQTFMLYAVDDRLKVAAPVCMVSSYMQGG